MANGGGCIVTYANPHWLEHQRRRWMRPDAERWLQPNRRLWFRPGALDRKYDPDQPRVPSGNPDGGQWTSGGSGRGPGRSVASEFSAIRRKPGFLRPKGHHFIARSVYRDQPLSVEARKVFDEATTGRLRGQLHGWSKGHREYNTAVGEALNEFMASRKISAAEMTGAQALEFVKQVKRSSDSRIREFNLNVLRQELRYILRFGPRRPE